MGFGVHFRGHIALIILYNRYNTALLLAQGVSVSFGTFSGRYSDDV